MKTEKNIFIAFIVNLLFSVFEFLGGIFTGSVSIISDALHDMGDAISIGISYLFEKKSKREPDKNYTYGYARYSVIGGLITTIILLIGSTLVVYNAIERIINPTQINYNGMIVLGVIGVVINLCAAWFTHEGDSLNQKAVHLHMLEDVLGWIVVLIGAIVMKFTDFALLDPILSIIVAAIIFISAIKNLKEILNLLLEKVPENISIEEIRAHLLEIDEVIDVHHIHIWSTDGYQNYATLHVVFDGDPQKAKKNVQNELKEHGIGHVTVELEREDEKCNDIHCHIEYTPSCSHHHHNH